MGGTPAGRAEARDLAEIGPQWEYAPYAPRLVADWTASERHRTYEGSLASFDLSGFTKLTERLATLGRDGAEEITVAVNSVFEHLIEIAVDPGGDESAEHDVVSFGGDAILVLFRGRDHAVRSARAAAAMQRFLRANGAVGPEGYRTRLKMSVGIHSGSFPFIRLGDSQWMLAVIGEDATHTVDLESDAEAGEILVSRETAAALPPDWVHPRTDGRLVLQRPAVPRPRPSGPRDPAPADARWLPPDARSLVASAEHFGEHRRAASGFVKLSGIDEQITRVGLTACADAISAVAAIVEDACSAFGVCWLACDIAPHGFKFILTAGAPLATETDEERMLRAIRAILDAFAESDPAGLELHVGATVGPVFAADLGHPHRRTYSVMGDTVNTAARLMQHADSGTALVTPAITDASASRFVLEPVEPFAVKGKARPLRAARLGAAIARSGASGAAQVLVGRESQHASVREAWDRAVAGATVVVEIRGEAGLGKSRLLAELLADIDGDAASIAVGQADPLAHATPYEAIRVPLRSIFGIPADAGASDAGRQLTTLVTTIAPELRPWLPLIALTVNAEVAPTPESDAIEEQFRRAQLEPAVVALALAAFDRPVLLGLEDGHWADESSLALLGAFARAESRHGVCVVTTTRPGGTSIPCEPETVTTVEMDPLDATAAATLALAEAGDTPIDDQTIEKLIERAGGSPLFVRGLVDAWKAGTQDLPATVERLAAARIDGLRTSDRLLLRRAAVVGRTVDLQLLAEALDDPAVLEPRRWAPVADFVEPTGATEIRFRHDLERDAAYAGLAAQQRRALHQRVAGALVNRDPDDNTTAALLSEHFFFGNAWSEAHGFGLRAAELARAAAAPLAAAEHLARAARCERLLRVAPLERATTLEALGDAYQLAGRMDEAAESFGAAQRLARGETLVAASIAVQRARAETRRGRLTTALRISSAARRRLEPDTGPGATATIARLWGRTSLVHHLQGRNADALEDARTAVRIAQPIDDPRLHAEVYLALELAASAAGTDDAEEDEIGARAAELCRSVGDHSSLGNVLNNMGVTMLIRGDWPRANALLEEASEAYALVGDIMGAATVDNNRCEILIEQGRLEIASTEVARLQRAFGAAGDAFMLNSLLCVRGLISARSGRLTEAAEDLGRAEREFLAGDFTEFWLDARLRSVEVLLMASRWQEALELCVELEDAERKNATELNPSRLRRFRGIATAGAGDHETAVRILEEVAEISETDQDPAEWAFALHALGMIRALTAEERARLARLTDQLDVVAYPEYPLGARVDRNEPVSTGGPSYGP